MIDLRLGDCLEVMRSLPENSVDAIVTDPPYGLSFMGKDWDHGVPGNHFWIEALRVAKPGAHLLAFGGTRTFHRLAVAIEDAGWEIRDCVMWVYGSGFPKSHDVSKAIDREAGASREVVGRAKGCGSNSGEGRYNWNSPEDTTDRTWYNATSPATPAAKQWQGWGTALKPAWEPIIVARKPFDCTVAQNVLTWGTGAINVDGCRVGTDMWIRRGGSNSTPYGSERTWNASITPDMDRSATGRWPANFIHDGSDEVLALMPETKSGAIRAGRPIGTSFSIGGELGRRFSTYDVPADSGSAARFFYCAKASKRDRDEGCEGLEENPGGGLNGRNDSNLGSQTVARNVHPTVKPTALMRYLCKLVTPPGGIILDPFMGSGSTGKAAVIEGFSFVGIDLNPEYIEIARRRIEFANSYLVDLQPALEAV